MNIREIRLAPAGDAPYATIAALEAAGGRLHAGISLAAAGDMALSRRFSHPWRSRLLEGLGVPLEKAFAVRQVHSRAVLVVKDEQPEELASREADGMITDRPNAFLSVTVADCLPIFLVDRASGAFGLVHSGWKGTGIAGEALRAMGGAFGTRAKDIAAVIGPGIGACCYAVPGERAAGFAAQFGPGAVLRAAGEDPRLDLRRANIDLLLAAGVTDISVVTDCTCCSPFLGSFRRQGAADFTLMLAFVGRVPHPRGG